MGEYDEVDRRPHLSRLDFAVTRGRKYTLSPCSVHTDRLLPLPNVTACGWLSCLIM